MSVYLCNTCQLVMFTGAIFSLSAQSWETPAAVSNQSPNPNNPAEYCSTIPPLQQAQASGVLSSPPPTVMVPVGVLKQPGNEGMTFTANKNTLMLTFFVTLESDTLSSADFSLYADISFTLFVCVRGNLNDSFSF